MRETTLVEPAVGCPPISPVITREVCPLKRTLTSLMLKAVTNELNANENATEEGSTMLNGIVLFIPETELHPWKKELTTP